MNCLPILAWALVTWQSAPTAPQANVDFKDTWSKIETSIRQRFYAREARKAEMDRLFAKYGPTASAAKNKTDFNKTVNEMIAEFGDSHFALITEDDQGYYLMDNLANPNGAAEMPHIGAWFKPTPKGLEISMLLEGAPAQAAGLRKGDVIETIDGQPFSPIVSLRDRVGKTASVAINRGGTKLTKNVEVKSARALDAFVQASRDSTKIIDHKGKKIGYFHLWTQASDAFRNTLKNAVLGRLNKTDAFILDLRDGFGGRPENFFEPFFMPDVDVVYEVFGIKQQVPFGYGTKKPLIVLINGGSRSAKEISSYMFKKSGRAVLIGTTTAGHVLGTTPSRLNAWSFLEIPIAEVSADGERLEKIGVSPNIVVSPEYDANGEDLVMKKALEYLDSKH